MTTQTYDKLRSAGIPDEYMGYAVISLDPFHDNAIKVEGAPSSVNAASIVLTTRQETTINASTFGLSTAAGAKWDLNICSLPVSRDFYGYPCNIVNALVTNSGTGFGVPVQFGPLTLNGVTQNVSTFVQNPTNQPANYTFLGTDEPLEYGTYKSHRAARLIGQAFEVVDVTPPIYQQGSVTVYEQPSTAEMAQYLVDIVDGPTVCFPMQLAKEVVLPPSTVQLAVKLPGSRTWDAKDGAYVSSRLTVDEAPFQTPNSCYPLLKGPAASSGSTTAGTFWPASWRNNQYNTSTHQPSTYNLAQDSLIVGKYNTSGAYFSGLSSQYGTLRIRFRQYWEVIPTADDSTLIPLTTPTLPRNRNVEDLVQRVLATQPAGWKFTDNPKGEVWRRLANVAGRIAKVSAPVLAAVDPRLGVISNQTGSLLISASAPKKRKPAPQMQQPQQIIRGPRVKRTPKPRRKTNNKKLNN